MQRFFVDFPLSIDVTLSDVNIIHQLARVLRVQVGEHIVLFDGDGSQTEYEITSIGKSSITLSGKNRTFPPTEPKTSITLYQALPNKLEKIEYILQKWVEVGIWKFVFFRSDRSQKLVISDNKKNRLTAIAREAVEQCGGVSIPEIEFFDGMIPSSYQKNESIHITLDTRWQEGILSEYKQAQNVGLWVGPEGGWSDEERQEMKEYGFIFARFWSRIMRTETAGGMIAFSLIHT